MCLLCIPPPDQRCVRVWHERKHLERRVGAQPPEHLPTGTVEVVLVRLDAPPVLLPRLPSVGRHELVQRYAKYPRDLVWRGCERGELNMRVQARDNWRYGSLI